MPETVQTDPSPSMLMRDEDSVVCRKVVSSLVAGPVVRTSIELSRAFPALLSTLFR